MNFTLIGDKVLIKLDLLPSHTTTESGLEIPLYEAVTTEGGKVKSQLSQTKYLSQGTIVDISPYSSQRASEFGVTLSPNDRVFVNPSAVSPHYQFFTDRSQLVMNFDGYVAVPVTLIDAKINGK